MNASITCKRCGAKCPICGHIAADLSGLAEMREKLSAAERARDEAREALERYGEHDGDCAASVIGRAGDTACTCGYDAALSPTPGAKQGK